MWGLTQGVTEGVTEGVPLGVDCADVESLSSLKSPLGILNFCREREKKKEEAAIKQPEMKEDETD